MENIFLLIILDVVNPYNYTRTLGVEINNIYSLYTLYILFSLVPRGGQLNQFNEPLLIGTYIAEGGFNRDLLSLSFTESDCLGPYNS